jgi:hypothetical protein
MQCIEIIRLRTRPEKKQEAMGWLLEATRLFRRLPSLRRVLICSGISVPSDLGLLLEWDHATLQTQGSDPATSITEGLRLFGLVDHSIWSVTGRVRPAPQEKKKGQSPEKKDAFPNNLKGSTLILLNRQKKKGEKHEER